MQAIKLLAVHSFYVKFVRYDHRVTVRDGRISDPAIRIRPDFHYPVKSGSGRIARGTPDRIFASYNTRHSLRMMSLRS